MPQFTYIAQDSSGHQVNGMLDAVTKRDALAQLVSKALLPVRITVAEPKKTTKHLRVPFGCFAQLADLLRNGVPMLTAIGVLRDQTASPRFKVVLSEIQGRLSDGAALSEALAARSDVFDPITIGIVQAGEEGGFLEEALQRLATLQQRSEEIRGRVIGAFVYPMILMVSGATIVLAILVFFVPTFEPIFEKLATQGRLPWSTSVLLTCSDLIRGYGVVLAIIAVATLLLRGSLNTRVPIGLLLAKLGRSKRLGQVINEITVARFCRVLGTLLRNEVPMVRALKITRIAVGRGVLADALQDATGDVADGGSLASHLRDWHFVPGDIAAMVAIGEQSNSLASVLLNAGEILEQRSSRRLDLLLKLVEPVLLLVFAAIVLFLVIGLMLPIFDASGAIQ
jgi:general secretion pathway protein F